MLSSFIFVNLALGVATLVLLVPFRSASGGLPKLALGVGLGLVAGVVVINETTSLLGTSRDSNIRPIVKYLLENADASKSQLLVVGSSYTGLGVDGSLIEREMNKKGFRLQVLELAKPGNFMISQDYTIDYYLARAKKVPEFIFIELGPEYYNDPGDLGPSYLNTGTAIADHTVGQLWWRARSLNAYDATPLEKLTKFWNLSTHVLFHIFDFGMSGQLIADKDVSANPGFEPEDVAHTPLKADELSPIRQSAVPLSLGPLPPHGQFLLAFRRMQVRKLKERGAKVVGFYQTAMTPTGIRVYGDQVCRELRDVPCITGDDPAIRKQLDHPALWFDPVHLSHPGAEKYSVWLADRLSSSLASFRRASE
jgi:hypothetical protein